MTTFRWAYAVLATALLLGGCASDDIDPPESESTASTAPAPATPSGSPSYDPLPWGVVDGLGRCGPQPQRVQDHDFEKITLRGPANARLPAVVSGRGETVAVLLHQTDGNGLCGWLGFAEEATSEPGLAVVALDLCGYGEARCSTGYASEQVDQVRLAVDYAARELEARRIVLVGASMGGALTVLTAAEEPRVDAVVDLSGPEDWSTPPVSVAARRLTAPVLLAMATDEGSDDVAAAQAAVAAAPAGSRLVEPAAGHGYELLAERDGRPTDLAARVLAWVKRS